MTAKIHYNPDDGTGLVVYPESIDYTLIPKPYVVVDFAGMQDVIANRDRRKVDLKTLQIVQCDPPALMPQSLADAQAAAWATMKDERDRRERLPLDYLGKQLDFDALSSDRLTWAIAAARSAIAEGKADFKLEWTCADNSPLTMTAQQIVDLPIAVAQRSDGLHRRARELRAAIDAAKTVGDVQKVRWQDSD